MHRRKFFSTLAAIPLIGLLFRNKAVPCTIDETIASGRGMDQLKWVSRVEEIRRLHGNRFRICRFSDRFLIEAAMNGKDTGVRSCIQGINSNELEIVAIWYNHVVMAFEITFFHKSFPEFSTDLNIPVENMLYEKLENGRWVQADHNPEF